MSIQTHIDSPAEFGKRLRAARVDAGLSQREVAFPGCTAVYVCRIELGGRVPSLQVLRELAARVGVSERWLATGVGPKAPPLMLALDSALIDNCLRRVTRDKQETGLSDLSDEERDRLVGLLSAEAENIAVGAAVRILYERPAL